MEKYIPLQIALTNIDNQVNLEDTYRYIEANSEDIQTYWIDPDRIRGRDVSAAFDYFILLEAAANVASLALSLWTAYEMFIRKRKQPRNAALLISIENPDGTRYNFWLGSEYTEKDIFIKVLTEQVSKFQKHPDAFRHSIEIMSQIENNDLWVRRKMISKTKLII